MNAWVGAILAVLAVASGWTFYRWQGVVLAFTIIAFWFLLQFNRAVRVMRSAQGAPVGHVPSAVMMNAKLHEGMSMMQVVTLTRSLGTRQGDGDDVWRWADADGSHVTLHFRRGKLQRWQLERPASPEP